MTSKEAIDLIATNCAMNCKKAYHEKCNDNCEIFKAFKVIKKDLEVLEILKKYLKVSALENWGAYYLDTKDSPIRIDIEEYAKLKEWLEK